MIGFLQDLRYAVRTLCKSPAATGIAILALAFGIGVNVSAFISANGVVLHPMPFAHLDRIETIWQSNPKLDTGRGPVATADFIDLEKQTSSFDALAACRSFVDALKLGTGSEAVRTAQVTASFFKVLSGSAELGRVAPLATNGVVVSNAFWKTRLAGAPDVLGRRLPLATGTATIIGVMPDNFDFPLGTEVWSPLVLSPKESQQRSTHNLFLLGLLKSGVATRQADADVLSISARLAAAYPATNRDEAFTVIPLRDLTDGVTTRFIFVILGRRRFCAPAGLRQYSRQLATRARHEPAERDCRAGRAGCEPFSKLPVICWLNRCCSQ